ncbi:hypothetical protein EB001_04675 [bacterium]|nr:hypothetical protein [bacterium]
MAVNNAVTNIAGVVSAITTTIGYTDTTVTIGTLPPNAQIVNVHIDVLTAFDAGTTNQISVGYTGGTTTAYVVGTNVNAYGRQGINTTGVLSAWDPLVPADSEVNVTCTYIKSGTAPTAGDARITVLYKSFSGTTN